MGDPIQNLREIVDGGRRLHQTHRNEWPDLWEAIDKLMGLSLTEYMFTADQYEPDRDYAPDWDRSVKSDLSIEELVVSDLKTEVLTLDDLTVEQLPISRPRVEGKLFIEVRDDDGQTEIMEVMRGQLSEDWSSPEDEVYDDSREAQIDIEALAGSDAEQWAIWFRAWQEENPDAEVNEIASWFARALSIGEVNQHPLIEVTMRDGNVVSMKSAEYDLVSMKLAEYDWNEGDWDERGGAEF